MNKISVLDCTLRDGGYINDFKFGNKTIKKIISLLGKANIDIIECGFLRTCKSDSDCTIFNSVESFRDVINEKKVGSIYVGMIQYGAISIDEIEDYDATSIDGIRLTFHEHEIDGAFEMAYQLKEKGYKVFVQPVGTTTYEDIELIKLVQRVNELKPYAFYMVDTLGAMYENDLQRMLYIIDANLDFRIQLGFHSHNNLQMSFANAQMLIKSFTKRDLIIDSSILGMGRGAGNLNTELIIHYLNESFGLKYDRDIILSIIDKYVLPIRQEYKWGYDAAYYLAAITNTHPNYASYLINLNTLNASDISTILNNLDKERRVLFDEDYITDKYLNYMEYYIDDIEVIRWTRRLINNKRIVLLAPGKSLKDNESIVNEIISEEDFFVISINFIPENIPIDMLFVSNSKRFSSINELEGVNSVVVTSNIYKEDSENVRVINYASYLNEDKSIVDNAGLMCINFLKRVNAKNLLLVGFDGFSARVSDNYYEESLYFDVEEERLLQMNVAIANKISQLKKQINIEFIGKTIYEKSSDI
ncbi:MAG: 4-hydroxy-2-ketovalerate aldolase [Lachnospiraceae bacterium]|nr:4-hydroxy-2-ketovalerate aldolase [Lachnospiraceae bacterium]